jgi:hypothetical protein
VSQYSTNIARLFQTLPMSWHWTVARCSALAFHHLKTNIAKVVYVMALGPGVPASPRPVAGESSNPPPGWKGSPSIPPARLQGSPVILRPAGRGSPSIPPARLQGSPVILRPAAAGESSNPPPGCRESSNPHPPPGCRGDQYPPPYPPLPVSWHWPVARCSALAVSCVMERGEK